MLDRAAAWIWPPRSSLKRLLPRWENLSAPPLNGIFYNSLGIKNWGWFSTLVKIGKAGDRAPLQPSALSVWVSGATKWPGWRMLHGCPDLPSTSPSLALKTNMLPSPLSLPLAYWRGLLLSMLLKLWLRRLRLDEPGLLEAPLPAAGTLEGPGNLKRQGLYVKITYCSVSSKEKRKPWGRTPLWAQICLQSS